MRSKDLATLSGLEQLTGAPVEEEGYVSTEERELRAYYDSLLHTHEEEEGITEDDLENLRSGL